MLISEIVTFGIKREVFSELAENAIKELKSIIFAVCDTFCGEKQFLLIIVPFYCFDQKVVCTKSKFSSGFSHFQTCWKSNISEYF